MLSFSKEETMQLKGVAIFLVLLGHCVPGFLPFAEVYVPIKRLVSQLGVEIFLIVSGIGVSLTYLNSPQRPVCFFVKRLVKLWPLYAFAMFFYYLVSIFVFHEDIGGKDLVSNLLWVQVFCNSQNEIYSASHFFSVLLVVYLLSFLMMLVQTRVWQCLVFLLSTVVFQMVCFQVYERFLFSDYIASFSLGLSLGLFICRDRKRIYSLFLLLNYVYCFFDAYDLLKATIGCVVFVLTLLTLKKISSLKGMDVICTIGRNSYVIYLGHNYFLWKWPELLAMNNSFFVTGGIILLATSVWLLVLLKVNFGFSRNVSPPVIKYLKEFHLCRVF